MLQQVLSFLGLTRPERRDDNPSQYTGSASSSRNLETLGLSQRAGFDQWSEPTPIPVCITDSWILILALPIARSSVPAGHSSTLSSFRPTQPPFVPHLPSTLASSSPYNYGAIALEQQPLVYTPAFSPSPLPFHSPQDISHGQFNPSAVTQYIPSVPSLVHPGLNPSASHFINHHTPVQAVNSSQFNPRPVVSPSSNELTITGHPTQERSFFQLVQHHVQ